MRPFLLILPLALCAATAHAQPDKSLAPSPLIPRNSTVPEQIKEDLTLFVTNLNNNTAFKNNSSHIYGANTAYWGANEWQQNWQELRIEIQVDELTVEKVEDKRATAKLRYHINLRPEPLIDATPTVGYWRGYNRQYVNAHFKDLFPRAPPKSSCCKSSRLVTGNAG